MNVSIEQKRTSLKALVICNAYPSDDALYRNGFIHRRVKSYLNSGINVEVFYHHEPVEKLYRYEFEGVSVTVGNQLALKGEIANNKYDVFLVHFAEPGRIEPLQELEVEQPILVWVHGFEAEAWYRRWFNFMGSAQDITAAFEKKKSYYLDQNKFFSSLMTQDQLDISFINVSRWFEKYIVEPDNHASFMNSVIIHNIVDENVFQYVPKVAEDRLNILSIRPFASRKYANDQTIDAILELSKRPFFNELNFTICGRGPLFAEVTRPIKDFKNVSLQERFFTQTEMADLHEQNGIFLSPTRFDSQGVSMGEATSSGLVTISTDIAAVPEFYTDHESGLLVEPESPLAIADAIEELYFDPDLFLKISENGARRMREQCGFEATIQREIDLILSRIGE